MPESHDTAVREYLGVEFDDLEQQQETSSLGMWLFLATEVLFFGGLFTSYTVYRVTYPRAFAEAGKELNITIGTINTAVLLVSSYFMALAVGAIKKGRSLRSAGYLACTWFLGFSFICLKGYEYYDDIQKHIVPGITTGYWGPNIPVGRMLYFIYYAMTGVHALHLTVALGIVSVLFFKTLRGKFSAEYHSPVEVSGLYWHFVDIVWIFLYPLLYLMDRHS